MRGRKKGKVELSWLATGGCSFQLSLPRDGGDRVRLLSLPPWLEQAPTAPSGSPTSAPSAQPSSSPSQVCATKRSEKGEVYIQLAGNTGWSLIATFVTTGSLEIRFNVLVDIATEWRAIS